MIVRRESKTTNLLRVRNKTRRAAGFSLRGAPMAILLGCSLTRCGVILAGFAVVAITAGCSRPFSARERMALTAPMPAQRLIVRTSLGNITVNADPAATEITADVVKTGQGSTQAQAHAALGDIIVALSARQGDDQTVVATAEHPAQTPSRSYEVEWIITAPPGLAVEVYSHLGNLEINGFEKAALADSDMGDITARGLVHGIRARTDLGKVNVEGGGPVDVRTDCGDIQVHLLAENQGPVTMHSGLGDVRLRLPSNRQGRLVADTDLGSLRLKLEGILMQTLRQRGHHFDAELGGMAEPGLDLSTDMGDVVITTYPAQDRATTASSGN